MYLFFRELFRPNSHGHGEDRRETDGNRGDRDDQHVINRFQHVHFLYGKQDDEQNRHERERDPD
jgi:hypothetical protein